MLRYFPAPYPGEWWYSLLCRYHVRSGNCKHQTTVRELFENKVLVQMGALFPNSTILRVGNQLPETLFPIRQFIIRNTLFPYFTRFYTHAEKEKMLRELEHGKSIITTSIRRFSDFRHWTPRYCPFCYAADKEQYGEAYWHIEHQIALAKYCPRHECRLISTNISPSQLSYTFFPLDSISLEEPRFDQASRLDTQISSILVSYQQLPLEYGITPDYNNLALLLGNKGYEVIQKHSPHTILDARRLYKDLLVNFGSELMTQVFGGEESIPTINRLCKWGLRTPERYALLQGFADIPAEVLFGPPVQSSLEMKLRGYQEKGILLSRQQVANEMGITIAQLEILVEKYGIKKLWRDGKFSGSGKLHKIAVCLDDDEFLTFKAALQASGFKYSSQFAKYCLFQNEALKKEDLTEQNKASRNCSGKNSDIGGKNGKIQEDYGDRDAERSS